MKPNPNAPNPDKGYQARGTHPTKGRVHLGWFPTAEEAQAARRKFNDTHCEDRDTCQHPEHVKERRVEA